VIVSVSARTTDSAIMPNGETVTLRMGDGSVPCAVCGQGCTLHIYRPGIEWRCVECVTKYGKDILPIR
jgi:hypothetical protein